MEEIVQPNKENKWLGYKQHLFDRYPKLLCMIDAKEVRVVWEEDSDGNPMSVTVYKNDGSGKKEPIFFEDINFFRHHQPSRTV